MFAMQGEDFTEPASNVDQVQKKLVEVNKDYMDKTQNYDQLYESHSRISQVCYMLLLSYVSKVQ